jgi:hypothetical protein
MHPRFTAHGFPAHPAYRGLQSSLGLFLVEHTSCSLGSSKGSILVQILVWIVVGSRPGLFLSYRIESSRFRGLNCSPAVISQTRTSGVR